MAQPLPWRSIWITGGSSGIGLELARLIDESLIDGQGGSVAISARSAGKLEAAARAGRNLSAHPLDVVNPRIVSEVVARIENTNGPIDLAVLGAGLWKIVSPENFDLEAIRNANEINYMGAVNCIAALLPGMMRRRSGHIAIIASVAGYRGLPKSIAYGPTKAALINLAECLRAELQPYGVKVSVINPGFVDTPMTESNPFPMPQMIQPEEAARNILKGLRAGDYEIVFPQPFGLGMKLLRILPDALFFWLIRRFVMREVNG